MVTQAKAVTVSLQDLKDGQSPKAKVFLQVADCGEGAVRS